MTKLTLGAALAAAVFAGPVFGSDATVELQAYAEENVRGWASSASVVAAIAAQNATHSGLTQADIDSMDLDWRAQVGTADTPVITPVISGPTAADLRAIVDASEGIVTEIFVMDNHGLNVAASDVTSDYWQGDEDKFLQTYPMGPDAVHISEVEFDESTQSYQAQISVSVVDPATGNPIGAMTVGVNADAFF